MQKLYIGYITIILSALFTLSSCNVQQENSDSKNSIETVTKKTYSRYELKQKITGLSGAFVIQELGNPESTSESGETEYWYYSQISIDQVTGKLDSSIQLVFDSQSKQVSGINF